MAGEWISSTLGEIVTLKRGYDLPSQNRTTGSYPIVSSSGITGWHNAAKVRGPGVVTGRYGTLGEVHYVTEDYWPLNTTLYVQDFKGNDPRFVAYLLRTIDFLSFSDKSSVPGVNRNHLHKASVRVPRDVSEQRAIADQLGSLDDKIELNKRMNRTLEKLARAFFKAWFIDFDPVKAKADGATSFVGMPQEVFDRLPDQFVETELGTVPEGWTVKQLGGLLDITMGQSPPSEFYNECGDGLPFHQGVRDYGFRFPKHRVYCTLEARLAQPEDILLSVRAPVGRINVADRKLVIGRGLAAVRHPAGYSSFSLYLLKNLFAVEDAVGDGTVYKAITKKFLLGMPVICPPDYLVSKANQIINPLDALIRNNEVETQILSEIRDALLPKLISGKIRVPHHLEAANVG